MNDKWIDDIRESLSDYEMDAPEGLWESLGVDKPAARPIAWRIKFATSVAAIALLIIGSAYFLWQSPIPTLKPNMIYSKAEGPSSRQNPHRISDNATISTQEKEISSHNPKKSVGIVHSSLEASASENNAGEQPEELLEEKLDSKISNSDKEEEPQNKEPLKKEYQENHASSGKSLYDQWHFKQKQSGDARNRYALAVTASGIGSHSEKSGFSGNFPSFSDPWCGDSNDANSNSPGYEDMTNSSEITYIHHRLPIKVGLTVQYNLSERIGIESGLTYSVLESDISVSKGNQASSGTRKLQYIGIPINLKVSACSWKYINIYFSAGVAGEKCISNKFETKSLSPDISLDSYSNMKEKPFQWSANAAVGVQISPTPIVGIFAEPGVSYYFNDGTSLPTIYKDRPLNFNLNLGIRFNLNP